VRGDQVCVSAGGGLVGAPLLRAAIEAAPALDRELGLRTTAVTGPFLPPDQWAELAALAAATPSSRLVRYVPDLAAEMAASAVSVSQCGYNTTMDVLASGTPAIVVPYAEGREDEQSRRARRLAELGAVTVLEAAALSPRSLVDAVRVAMQGSRSQVSLRLDGARRTTELIASLLAR